MNGVSLSLLHCLHRLGSLQLPRQNKQDAPNPQSRDDQETPASRYGFSPRKTPPKLPSIENPAHDGQERDIFDAEEDTGSGGGRGR
jgi:hypothetical protein